MKVVKKIIIEIEDEKYCGKNCWFFLLDYLENHYCGAYGVLLDSVNNKCERCFHCLHWENNWDI